MITFFVILSVILHLCAGACPTPLPNSVVPAGYCASVWTTNVNQPRGITVASNGDVLVLERGLSQVSLFYQGTSGLVKVALATASGLNHAVLIHNGFLYASSASTVFRWRYTAGNRTNLGTAQTVITGIPTPGHSTRTLLFNSDGLLLVQVGSNQNVDNNADRAGIRQFNLSTIPRTFTSGAWFARGLRNEVGVRADAQGRVWGIENGIDNLNRADLGGDIHNGNPGEELNLFATPNQFYGYPFCWSQYNLPSVSTPRNTQYAHPNFINDGTHTDAWCQTPTNVVKPLYSLRPHIAPLDLLFYYGSSFPNVTGHLFVAEHGSWNSNPSVGYRVTLIRFDPSTTLPVSDEPFLSYVGPGDTGSGWHRPVGLAVVPNGVGGDRLLVTSDSTNTIISVQYSP